MGGLGGSEAGRGGVMGWAVARVLQLRLTFDGDSSPESLERFALSPHLAIIWVRERTNEEGREVVRRMVQR